MKFTASIANEGIIAKPTFGARCDECMLYVVV